MVFSAGATTITFNGLVNTNFTPLVSPYVESTYTVTPTVGTWFEAHNFGNPVPSIFATSASATVRVQNSTISPFLFSSVDLADAGGGGATYLIEGKLGGSTMFSITDGALPGSFLTVPNTSPLQPVDALFITLFRAVASYNIDNIVLQQVPEPSALAVVGFGAIALTVFRRRKITTARKD